MEIFALLNNSKASKAFDKNFNEKYDDMVGNLRFQLALFDINNYLHKTKVLTSKQIHTSVYKNLRIIKAFFVFLYSFIVFFEKPLHCYKSTTFYTVESKTSNECDPMLEMIRIFFPEVLYYRCVELFLLFSFTLIQIVFWSERRVLGKYSIHYKLLQLSLFVLIVFCSGDIIFSIIFDFFPLVNFFLRGIIMILLIRNLRLVWVNIIYLLYDTKNIFFLLLASLFWFGLLGNILFPFNEDFSNIITSIYSLFILLATCNFPDVMLGTFNMDDKTSLFYFVLYIIMNFFIILSLLKSLYYSSFFEVYKERAKKIIRYLEEKEDRELLDREIIEKVIMSENFQKFLMKLRMNFSFTKKEYRSLIDLVGIKDSDLIDETFYSFWSEENRIPAKSLLTFLRKRKVELIITLVDLAFNTVILIVYSDESLAVIIIQMVWCLFFIFEFVCYIYYEGLMNFLKTDLIRFLYLFVNVLYFIGNLIALVMYFLRKDRMKRMLILIYPLVLLRSVRFFVLFNYIPEFRIIFTTLHNMKTIFYGLISTLFSFFLIFSTISMFFTGGNIKNNSFDEIRDIPSNYKYLNFNDFVSSFLSCFALMMINNTNILSRSLSFGLNKFYMAYFAAFYFMAALIILNIIQTLLLEMYLSIKANKIDAEEEEDKKIN